MYTGITQQKRNYDLLYKSVCKNIYYPRIDEPALCVTLHIICESKLTSVCVTTLASFVTQACPGRP